MMENPCDGCRVTRLRADCYYSQLDGCPCTRCLVKAMCKSPCDELADHWDKTVIHVNSGKEECHGKPL